MTGGWYRKHVLEVWPALMAARVTMTDPGGFCWRRLPHCTGGWVRIALSHTSATTTLVGILAAIVDWCCLLSAWFPRVQHRAALPCHRPMPGVRCAGARAPSPRSSSTAVWGVRSKILVPMTAYPSGLTSAAKKTDWLKIQEAADSESNGS